MAQQDSQLIDSVIKNSQFDEEWYRSTYRDVAQLEAELKITPLTHYKRYGSLMQRAPNADLALHPEKLAALTLPAPQKDTELLAAYRMALGGDHDRAISYARHHLPAHLAHTVHLLEANRAVAAQDRAGWLSHVNSYMRHYSMAELQLGQGGGNLLEELTTIPLLPVTDGPLVSILMPAWNAQETVGYAIRSILSQTWRNLELLVVDDASDDGTWQILRQFAESDPRVRIFRNAVNVGPYVSKNIAVSQAKGDWITGHDADDWAHPERIERQVGFCREKNIPACMSGMVRVAANGQFVRLSKAADFFYDGACRGAFISVMIHAQFFHDLLGFWDSVRVGGDSELLRRMERLLGRTVPQLKTVTMLCLDNPDGLTNHATLGHSDAGVSPHRKAYKKNYTTLHTGINRLNSLFEFPPKARPFDAPAEMLNPPGQIETLIRAYRENGVTVARDIVADVTIATDLRFPGGNASSSMDEIAFFTANGLTVSVIHCPIDGDLGKTTSDRYLPWRDKITNWSRVGSISTKVLICRHPGVALSSAFRKIASFTTANDAFVVVNNSYLRENGTLIYDRARLLSLAQDLKAGSVTFCPISATIRAELRDAANKSKADIRFSATDWNPTFDLLNYYNAPKARMAVPFRIGRHGRDAPEKWHEDPVRLLQAYPDNGDFRNIMLGGAAQVGKILGTVPSNWTVHEFGEIEPRDYLCNLDAFVYFPHSARIEAFGRTVVEAMLAGVPVILPRNFEPTFDDLPIYASPGQVEGIVRMLGANDAARVAYLAEVQKIAMARYSSPAIAGRMVGTGLNIQGETMAIPELSFEAMNFRSMAMATR